MNPDLLTVTKGFHKLFKLPRGRVLLITFGRLESEGAETGAIRATPSSGIAAESEL
jgi:hypothetical protein